MSLQVISAQPGVFVRGSFRPISELTDRAKRYRANATVSGSRRCFASGVSNPRDVHHIDGNESNCDKRNLARCCRPCNTKIANAMRKAGIGIKTRQYNPKRRKTGGGTGANSLGQYLSAVQIVRGDQPGNVASAVKTLQATSSSERSQYAAQIWKIRKERYGPSGRKDSVPF